MSDLERELWTRRQVAEFVNIPESEVRGWAVANEVFMSTILGDGFRYARVDVKRAAKGEAKQR